MFIIPVGNRVDWKRPPVATLLLILINCLVFFVLQSTDERAETKAAQYYAASDLPGWEYPRYADYLERQNMPEERQRFLAVSARSKDAALVLMESDARFIGLLGSGQIITSADAEFNTWKNERHRYESMRSFTSRYVYEVDDPRTVTMLVSAFMHGGIDHLLGNMLVLFLVGFLVEAVVGKALFLLAYFLSIGTATLVFTLTAAPGVSALGASGAIAGVMGLYAVVFGLRKIDFFYSIGFYFDYVRAPALLLLPLWLGNELFQFLSERHAQIGYMAHFGGLLGGAAIGIPYRWLKSRTIAERHQAVERGEAEAETFQRGMDHLGAMEFRKALDIFKSLQAQHPADIKLKWLVYRAAKSEPAGDDYHRAAIALLASGIHGADADRQIHQLFHEYLDTARPAPRLRPDLLANLAKRFADANYQDDAEKLATLLQRAAPAHSALPSVLLALARGYYRAQRREKFEATIAALMRQFPDTEEAQAAGGMLRIA
ncbi:MAG TPA: rhomboid family intramembrane serine protease [Oxalicibacterium sp.]|nr:rhomboid family intramembrane serine protease [Oxalicibacterium sp.]